ncbi:MAG: LPS assembly protein LptD [Devosia sp.]
MVIRPERGRGYSPRALLARVGLGFFLLLGTVIPAHATLLPAGFFDMQVQPGQGAAAVEADQLSYDGRTGVITASGDVLLSYQGFTVRADRVDFNQQTGELHAIGSVKLKDSGGNLFEMDSIEVTGGMKEAFINSLTLTTSAGALITARDVRYANELATILTEASYSPCGLCVDSKGRKIGWKVKAAKMIYDRENASVILEQPSLEVLGIPVAWLPWFWVPDPTQPRARGFRSPSVGSSATRGYQVTVPFFVPVGQDVDILLSPTLMSRQGFLAKGDLTWRIPSYGTIEVHAAGLYQLDKSAFLGKPGFRDWRGAIQTAGTFTPIKNWTAGWSYSVFSDPAFIPDYELGTATSSINQLYATQLSDQTYFDARVQRFTRLGDIAPADDQTQGVTLPKVTFEHVQDLEPGWGRFHLTGEVLGVHRELDQTATVNGVPYTYGYKGDKAHGMLEGAWENQFILPGGVAATPYLGTRLDASWYNGASAAPGAPPASVLFSATPIAALDVRWPLIGHIGASTHVVEPIAQIVYRGSSTTRVGITNDDAHSFVFDTSNLFSYNRFSGIDRQETGLRANIGGHYLGDFADGSWLDLVAGQSFQLAGVNALGVSDQMQVGTNTGLGGTSSFIVASARGGVASGNLTGAAKVQIDPSLWRVTRGGVGGSYSPLSWLSLSADYIYIAATPTLGVLQDQHEVTASASVRPFDYWTFGGSTTWNLGTSAWLQSSASAGYDDGYFAITGTAGFKPGSWGWALHFNLKGPDGQIAF